MLVAVVGQRFPVLGIGSDLGMLENPYVIGG